jgi:hypothetical protein
MRIQKQLGTRFKINYIVLPLIKTLKAQFIFIAIIIDAQGKLVRPLRLDIPVGKLPGIDGRDRGIVGECMDELIGIVETGLYRKAIVQ